MKPKEAIMDLWSKGYFESVRATKEIYKNLADEYGTNPENITAVLNSCKSFLKRKRNGWIQRTRYDGSVGKNENDIDYFALLNIHPKVLKASKKLFLNGHYPMAIFEAFKQVEIAVKEKSGIRDKFGAALMQEVFSANTPILKINDGVKDSSNDEQKGFMMLFTGAQIGIRDPKGHYNIEQKDPKMTMQYIAFASLLCQMVDKSFKVADNKDGDLLIKV